MAWRGAAWHGEARQGAAWQGGARHGVARHSKARQGKARQGKAMRGFLMTRNSGPCLCGDPFCPRCFPTGGAPQRDRSRAPFADCSVCGRGSVRTRWNPHVRMYDPQPCEGCQEKELNRQAQEYFEQHPPEPRPCAHGNPPGECNACDVAGDMAYDAARESAFFGGR